MIDEQKIAIAPKVPENPGPSRGEEKNCFEGMHGIAWEEIMPEKRVIAMTDIHGDYGALRKNLKLVGITNKAGDWEKNVENVVINISGDVLDRFKGKDNRKILEYVMHLKESAPETCEFTLQAGNHEVAILQQSAKGKKVGLKKKHLRFLAKEFDAVRYDESGALFIHTVPSLTLLRKFEKIVKNGGNINDFNKTYHQSALACIKKNKPTALQKFDMRRKDGNFIGTENKLKYYYNKTRKKKMRQLCKKLGISAIVYGHMKQKDGTQKYALAKKFNDPNDPTFVNIDCAIGKGKVGKKKGNKTGVTLLENIGDSAYEFTFMNKKNKEAASEEIRKRVAEGGPSIMKEPGSDAPDGQLNPENVRKIEEIENKQYTKILEEIHKSKPPEEEGGVGGSGDPEIPRRTQKSESPQVGELQKQWLLLQKLDLLKKWVIKHFFKKAI